MMTPEPKTIDEYRDALETLNRDEMLVGLRLQVAEIQARRLKIEALTAERDGLTAANRDLQDWFDALKTDHEALKAELEIARMVPYVAAMSEIAKERDALKDAARLALDALVEIIDMNVQYCIDKYSDSSQAETMSCVITARKAISSLKKIL